MLSPVFILLVMKNMALFQENRVPTSYCFLLLLFFFFFFFLASLVCSVSSTNAQFSPSKPTRLTDQFPRSSFKRDTSILYGEQNVKLFNNGSYASISLDKKSGSGLASKNYFSYGFFSVAMKLPPGYTSGVVVAFYLTNSGIFPHNHDEVDFELLGHEKRKEWILQTNIYGNGSVSTGREEKFHLWFDPSAHFHEYSILWNNHHVLFLVDNIPVREVLHTAAMSPTYPSKPMSLYTTIWDASDWATAGGKYPVDYRYAPFTLSLAKLEMTGCKSTTTTGAIQTCASESSTTGSSALDPVDGHSFAKLSQEQAQRLQWARTKYMIYSYCKDLKRYKVPPPECST